MSDYRAIDAEALRVQLSRLAGVIDDADVSDEQIADAEDAMSEINELIHGFDQPVEIRDRHDTIVVITDKNHE